MARFWRVLVKQQEKFEYVLQNDVGEAAVRVEIKFLQMSLVHESFVVLDCGRNHKHFDCPLLTAESENVVNPFVCGEKTKGAVHHQASDRRSEQETRGRGGGEIN